MDFGIGPLQLCVVLVFYAPFLTTSCERNFDDIDFLQIVEGSGAFFVICHTWSFIGYFLFEMDI